eukprot:6199760-Amphidinium_carterae.1
MMIVKRQSHEDDDDDAKDAPCLVLAELLNFPLDCSRPVSCHHREAIFWRALREKWLKTTATGGRVITLSLSMCHHTISIHVTKKRNLVRSGSKARRCSPPP